MSAPAHAPRSPIAPGRLPKAVDMLRRVVASGAFRDDPFTLVDVGCALGINRRWRLFDDQLRAVGVDPQIGEIERLAAAETLSSVSYRAALFGLPLDNPFHAARAAFDRTREAHFRSPLGRSSTRRAQVVRAQQADTPKAATQQWQRQQLATERVTLRDVAELEGLRRVDFVKTDTDGADLEAMLACEAAFRDLGVLGVLVEVPFAGSDAPVANAFHNIDRVLRRNDFSLFSLGTMRYSRAALPAQFERAAPSQTVTGQVIWGDALYFRDAASPSFPALFGAPLPPAELLKLACLFELFELPDCAAEILVVHREQLQELADVDALLDLLTPLGPDGTHVPYAEYVARFEVDPSSFYPR